MCVCVCVCMERRLLQKFFVRACAVISFNISRECNYSARACAVESTRVCCCAHAYVVVHAHAYE